MKKSRSQQSEKSRQVTAAPRYALRKGLRAWELTFKGKRAVLKHEQGIHYVAYLLAHPPAEPIHALDLATRLAEPDSKASGITEIADPATGRALPLERHARLQERGLGLDAAETMRRVLRSQNELEAILEDPLTIEPVREEVQRELIGLYRYEEANTARTRDSAQRCVRAVRMAIRRFHQHLATAVDAQGRPDPVPPPCSLSSPPSKLASPSRTRTPPPTPSSPPPSKL
ncbi:MAG TPA: hypothetical protein VNZ64_23105 [Candidatus Acidoferrum sp.]|jgi:hypothetical protein|nr:hypothetical protein [Candidatus Acidoferrum sp.]